MYVELFFMVLRVGFIFIFKLEGIIKMVIVLLLWFVVIIVIFFWIFFKRIELNDCNLMLVFVVFCIIVLLEVNFMWIGSVNEFRIFCKWYFFGLVKGLKVVLNFNGSIIEFWVLL